MSAHSYTREALLVDSHNQRSKTYTPSKTSHPATQALTYPPTTPSRSPSQSHPCATGAPRSSSRCTHSAARLGKAELPRSPRRTAGSPQARSSTTTTGATHSCCRGLGSARCTWTRRCIRATYLCPRHQRQSMPTEISEVALQVAETQSSSEGLVSLDLIYPPCVTCTPSRPMEGMVVVSACPYENLK